MNSVGREVSVIAIGIVFPLLTASGVALAAQPTSDHVRMCNDRAAQAGSAQRGGQPGATGPKITTDQMPGQPVPGAAQPGTPSNPTGGRITDSSQPGAPPAASSGTVSPDVLQGMAPTGQSDPAYRQSYVVCMRQLGY